MEIIKPKTLEYYDLDEIMETMENNGFMSKRKFWADYVCEWGVSNDTLFYLGFGYYNYGKRADEFKEYFTEVNKLIGMDESNEGIMVKVSW